MEPTPFTIPILRILAAAALFIATVPASHAEIGQPAGKSIGTIGMVSIQAPIIEISQSEDDQFVGTTNASTQPAETLAALERLVAQRRATTIGIPAVSARGGERGVSASAACSLHMQSVLSPDRKSANADIVLEADGKRTATGIVFDRPGVTFLSREPSPTNQGRVRYIFVRYSRGPSPGPVAAKSTRSSNPLTVQAVMIALRHDRALLFAASTDLSKDPAEALARLQKLAAQQKTGATGPISVHVEIGKLEVSESGKRSLLTGLEIDTDTGALAVDLIVRDRTYSITSGIVSATRDVQFLGTLESPVDPELTQFIFIRTSP